MGSSPTNGVALLFPIPGVYSALPPEMRCFTASFSGDVKPLVPGTWFKLASSYFQALISHPDGGKSKGATKKMT